MRTILTASAICLAIAATPALSVGEDSSDGPSTADVKCLVVGLAMSQSSNQGQASAAPLVSLYYLGKIDGRDPNLDLERNLGQLSRSMTQADIRSAAARCSVELEKRSESLRAIAARLQASESAKGL
jgi:hypothetical protein